MGAAGGSRMLTDSPARWPWAISIAPAMPPRLLILTAIAALIPLFAFAPSEAGAQAVGAFMAIEKQNGILTAHEQGGPIASDLIVSNETAGSPGGVTRLEIRDGSGGAVSPLGS